MCRDNNLIMIDGDKLHEELRSRTLKGTEASIKMGFSQNYISKVCSRGKIKKSSLNLLDTLFGIKYEDIQPDPIVEPEPEIKPDVADCEDPIDKLVHILEKIKPVPTNYKALEAAIRNGVRAGITDILTDGSARATCIEIIKNAHKQALRENLKERIQEQGGKLR